jgi:hypothetical protein
MKLIVLDYMFLGVLSVIIVNHVVFVIYDNLRSRWRGKKAHILWDHLPVKRRKDHDTL